MPLKFNATMQIYVYAAQKHFLTAKFYSIVLNALIYQMNGIF